MILYQLLCSAGHRFEGWFQSSAAYDAQAAAGEVACPHCGSSEVTKAVMAPHVATRDRSDGAPQAEAAERVQMVRMVAQIREFVEKNFEDVGAAFADEARAIHYGEAEERGIYGEATPQEVRELIDEGVEVMPLPGRPKRKMN